MTLGALRVSALALSAAAFVLSSPLSAAGAATVVHHSGHSARAAHTSVSHGLYGYVARSHAGHRYVARDHAGHRHYVWRDGHRYVYYGYNPGAAVAGGVIAGAAAGYPYCGDSYYGSYYGSCDDYSYGYQYPYYDYDYGFGGPVFFGGDRFHHGFHNQGFGFHGNGAHFAGGNFGHMGGFGGGHVGGFGGGGFGGGHMGGFGGGHFGGGGHFR